MEAFWPGISSFKQPRYFLDFTVPDNHVHYCSLFVARRCSLEATATVTTMVFRGLPATPSVIGRRVVARKSTCGAVENVRAEGAGACVSMLAVPRRGFMQLASIFFAASVTRLSIDPERAAAETESDVQMKEDETNSVSEGSTTGGKYTVGSDEVG